MVCRRVRCLLATPMLDHFSIKFGPQGQLFDRNPFVECMSLLDTAGTENDFVLEFCKDAAVGSEGNGFGFGPSGQSQRLLDEGRIGFDPEGFGPAVDREGQSVRLGGLACSFQQRFDIDVGHRSGVDSAFGASGGDIDGSRIVLHRDIPTECGGLESAVFVGGFGFRQFVDGFHFVEKGDQGEIGIDPFAGAGVSGAAF